MQVTRGIHISPILNKILISKFIDNIFWEKEIIDLETQLEIIIETINE